MATRKINLSVLKIIIVIIIFVIFGYAFGRYESQNSSLIDQIFGDSATYSK
jgi:hypothetical protein